MYIGLWSDNHNFPSLPLMKLSAYYKSMGDTVELYSKDTEHYDVVFISKVFTETTVPDIQNAERILQGGSGISLTLKLNEKIEHIYPDYSLYPEFKFALGWLTRGCPRKDHGFCITPKKDGYTSVKVADVTEFWKDQKEIVLLDQNLLACPDKFELLSQLADTGARVDYTGGLDARYVDQKIVEYLKQIPAKSFHFSWDNPKEGLADKFKFIANSGLTSKDGITIYVLVNYWSTFEEDMFRINTLLDYGLKPYVMIYDKQKFVDQKGHWLKGIEQKYTRTELEHFKVCQHLQRWCNTRRIVSTVPNFQDYTYFKTWVENGSKVPTIKEKDNGKTETNSSI